MLQVSISEILQRLKLLEAKVASIVQTADVAQRLKTQGFEPVGSSADEFAAYIKGETEKYGKLVHDAGLKFD